MGGGRPHCQNKGACSAKTPGKHCQPCSAQSPEVRARKSAALRAKFADPVEREKKRATLRKTMADPVIFERRKAAARATLSSPAVRAKLSVACGEARRRRIAEGPAFREMVREQGRKHGSKNLTALHAPESRRKAAEAIRAVHLAWCPREYWDLNTTLKRAGYRLPERKEMIAEEVRRNSPEATAQREARELIERITQEMHAKQAREKAQAY